MIEDASNGDENFIKSEISFFIEREEVASYIIAVCGQDWKNPFHAKWDWLVNTISKYQELSTVLNPYLEELVTPLTICMLDILKSLNLSVDKPDIQNQVSIIWNILLAYL